jgi:hypothetical protein
MFNIKEWLCRAVEFTEKCRQWPAGSIVECSVSPPITESEANQLSQQLALGLPPPLRRFFIEGARCCKCSSVSAHNSLPGLENVFPGRDYIYGGPRLCDAATLVRYQQECLEWADSFDEYMMETSADDSILWHSCVPFLAIGNGDHLGLDVATSREAPPVVYLCHDGDGGSGIIAPSFEEFLSAWEQICYVGPEIWLLQPFLDPLTNILTSDLSHGESIRHMFNLSWRAKPTGLASRCDG